MPRGYYSGVAFNRSPAGRAAHSEMAAIEREEFCRSLRLPERRREERRPVECLGIGIDPQGCYGPAWNRSHLAFKRGHHE